VLGRNGHDVALLGQRVARGDDARARPSIVVREQNEGTRRKLVRHERNLAGFVRQDPAPDVLLPTVIEGFTREWTIASMEPKH
jgi:hypothetical protein